MINIHTNTGTHSQANLHIQADPYIYIYTDWLYLFLGLCLCDKLTSDSNARSKESLGQFHNRNANEMARLLGNYSQNIASINCSLQKYKITTTGG